jgi:hypothetical protein
LLKRGSGTPAEMRSDAAPPVLLARHGVAVLAAVLLPRLAATPKYHPRCTQLLPQTEFPCA